MLKMDESNISQSCGTERYDQYDFELQHNLQTLWLATR